MSSASPESPSQPLPEPSHFLDARGDGATWGILKVARALVGLQPGQVLEVIGSDPRLLNDLPPVLEGHGCRLLGVEQGQGLYRFLLTRPGPPGFSGQGRVPQP